MRLRALRLCVVVGAIGPLVAGPAPRAGAGTVIEVFPGPDAIQNAVDAADPGDTLLIHAGSYPEHVVVATANLTLRAYGDGTVTVDAGCAATATIDVDDDGVRIDGLAVQGGSYYEVDFKFVSGGSLLRSALRDSCDALYGVNVFQNNGAITIARNTASGFADAGIYVGAIDTTGAEAILVVRNLSFGNNRGIIVEDTTTEARILVARNRIVANTLPGISTTTAGIFLHNADGVRVDGNRVVRNEDAGIHLDPASSDNVVTDNRVSGHTFDLANFGSGNCFSGNTYTTSIGPLPPCP